MLLEFNFETLGITLSTQLIQEPDTDDEVVQEALEVGK